MVCGSGGDFLAEAEVLFDRRDAFKRVVDFLCESRIARALLLQPLNAAVDDCHLGRDVAQTVVICIELLIDVLELVEHF